MCWASSYCHQNNHLKVTANVFQTKGQCTLSTVCVTALVSWSQKAANQMKQRTIVVMCFHVQLSAAIWWRRVREPRMKLISVGIQLSSLLTNTHTHHHHHHHQCYHWWGVFGPILSGHSGHLCHALSLWTSILHCHSPGVATVARHLRYSWLRLILVVVDSSDTWWMAM